MFSTSNNLLNVNEVKSVSFLYFFYGFTWICIDSPNLSKIFIWSKNTLITTCLSMQTAIIWSFLRIQVNYLTIDQWPTRAPHGLSEGHRNLSVLHKVKLNLICTDCSWMQAASSRMWSWAWSAVTAVRRPPPGCEVELGLQWLQSDPPSYPTWLQLSNIKYIDVRNDYF